MLSLEASQDRTADLWFGHLQVRKVGLPPLLAPLIRVIRVNPWLISQSNHRAAIRSRF